MPAAMRELPPWAVRQWQEEGPGEAASVGDSTEVPFDC
jgi:hypothetical protein